MTTGFQTAATGMVWAQKSLDVTANNIANLSTEGYKADKASFADLLYNEVRAPGAGSGLKVGHGPKLGKTDTLFGDVSLDQTDRPQDYALADGRNFFAVRTADGKAAYTRDGKFIVSRRADGQYYLADASGEEVLDPNGRPITVKDEKKPQNVGVFTFRSLDGLRKTGDNNYAATDRSGPAVSVSGADIRNGFLEASSADMATEISDMVIQERAYELDAKMAVMTDEVMQTVNNLR